MRTYLLKVRLYNYFPVMSWNANILCHCLLITNLLSQGFVLNRLAFQKVYRKELLLVKKYSVTCV
jgi:hypothetical protein